MEAPQLLIVIGYLRCCGPTWHDLRQYKLVSYWYDILVHVQGIIIYLSVLSLELGRAHIHVYVAQYSSVSSLKERRESMILFVVLYNDGISIN